MTKVVLHLSLVTKNLHDKSPQCSLFFHSCFFDIHVDMYITVSKLRCGAGVVKQFMLGCRCPSGQVYKRFSPTS